MNSDRREWHLEKNVSVGHILLTAGMIVGGFSYMAAIESRLTRLETIVQHQQALYTEMVSRQTEMSDRFTDRLDDMRLESKADFQRLESKVDALVEEIRAGA